MENANWTLSSIQPYFLSLSTSLSLSILNLGALHAHAHLGGTAKLNDQSRHTVLLATLPSIVFIILSKFSVSHFSNIVTDCLSWVRRFSSSSDFYNWNWSVTIPCELSKCFFVRLLPNTYYYYYLQQNAQKNIFSLLAILTVKNMSAYQF